MNEEKLSSLKESINKDSIRLSRYKIEDQIESYLKQKEISNTELANLNYDIQNYFYSISESLFDTFVSEGGSSEYSYKTFKTYYMPIFYSFLRDFFINDYIIKNFMSKLDKDNYNLIYMMCEDNLFSFISLYYFNPKNKSRSYAVENILYSIIEYDCDSEYKEERYKNILFTHFIQSKLNEIKENIDSVSNDSRLGQQTYTNLRNKLKSVKGKLWKKDGCALDKKTEYLKNIDDIKRDMKILSKSYSDNNKKTKELTDRYYYYGKLTREEFESDKFKNKEE